VLWGLAATAAIATAAFELPRFILFVGLGLLGGDAAFRTMLFVATGKGAFWFAALLLFPLFPGFGYLVIAFIRRVQAASHVEYKV
jgi:hypothetical protein